MADFTKWEGPDGMAAFIMGIVSGIASVFTWFSSRIGKVHARIDEVRELTVSNASSIAVLKSQHADKLERLNRMDQTIGEIDKKMDRQTDILMNLKNRP